MLTFRKIDYSRDLGQIIELIRKNLDPEYTPDFFRWKHMDNPFGSSYGRLALDGEKIVGLRMFMFWEFFDAVNKRKISAIRPVDTVTDKDYRGRGLFKKLTLEGLEECENEYDFVFNTPNQNSLPGYLKMGWKRIDNIGNFKVGLINFLHDTMKVHHINLHQLEHKFNENTLTQVGTLRSLDYLKWRYCDNAYKTAVFGESEGFIIYKRKKIKGFPVLVIQEMLGYREQFSKMLSSLGKKLKVPFVYYYKSTEFTSVKFLAVLKLRKPVVVCKDDKYNISEYLDPSIGDLEGIL